MVKVVFAGRIFPGLGNENEFSLLSLNGKIAMPNIACNISLKGYVGGLDFDRSKVDKELAKTGGKVNVHFVGLNASDATIASLGAAHISIFE